MQLAARLRRSHLLFLGYAVDDWSLRVFLRRVWGHDRLAYRSWAVAARRRGTSRASSGASAASRCTTSRSSEYAEELARVTGCARGLDAAVSAARSAVPYKGLARFGDSELDARLFFGRERETEVVAANLDGLAA